MDADGRARLGDGPARRSRLARQLRWASLNRGDAGSCQTSRRPPRNTHSSGPPFKVTIFLLARLTVLIESLSYQAVCRLDLAHGGCGGIAGATHTSDKDPQRHLIWSTPRGRPIGYASEGQSRARLCVSRPAPSIRRNCPVSRSRWRRICPRSSVRAAIAAPAVCSPPSCPTQRPVTFSSTLCSPIWSARDCAAVPSPSGTGVANRGALFTLPCLVARLACGRLWMPFVLP